MDQEILQALLGAIAGVIGIVTTFIKTFKWVKEGERGVKLRFGKYKKVIEPGFVFLIPFVEELQTMHVRVDTKPIPKQAITLKDKLTFVVGALVVFKIDDVYKAMFNIDKVRDSISDIAATVLREELSKNNYEEAADLEKLSETLLSKLKSLTENWGVEFLRFAVADFAPTPETSEVMIHIKKVEAQVEGNQLLITDLKKNKAELKSFDDPSIFSALTLRGSQAVVSV